MQMTKHLNLMTQVVRTLRPNTKYQAIIIDEHRTFREYMAQLRQKSNSTNSLLAKLRYQVSSRSLKTIYFAVFDSHIRYEAQKYEVKVATI